MGGDIQLPVFPWISCDYTTFHRVRLRKEVRLMIRPPLYVEKPCLVDGLEGPCHVSKYRPTSKGYCQRACADGKMRLVHRLAWEEAFGPIPEGMVIDHRCRVRACQNVAHLRLVTKRINALENSFGQSALNARKTHCIHGHEYTPENTKRDKNGDRECRTCHRISRREYERRKYHRRKARKLSQAPAAPCEG